MSQKSEEIEEGEDINDEIKVKLIVCRNNLLLFSLEKVEE